MCPFYINFWRFGPFKLDFHENVPLRPIVGRGPFKIIFLRSGPFKHDIHENTSL